MTGRFFLLLLIISIPVISHEHCVSWIDISAFQEVVDSLHSRSKQVDDTLVRRTLGHFFSRVGTYVDSLVQSTVRDPHNGKEMILKAKSVLDLKDALPDTAIRSSLMHEFDSVYIKLVNPDLSIIYRSMLDTRNQLMNRKYFGKDMERANLIEGWLNAHVLWTKTIEPDNKQCLRTFGVSPLEIVLFRLEPVVIIGKNNYDAGGLVTIGLTYHFLPEKMSCGNRFRETFFTKAVQRTGLRFGLGSSYLNREFTFAYGGALQVYSFGFWIVVLPKYDRKVNFGISATDLSFLGKIIAPFKK